MGTPNAAEWWAGEGGNQYLQRNRVDWRRRIPFWRRVIDETGARSVYEIGCNAGWNLSAIRRAFPDVELYGHDVCEAAVKQAVVAGLDVYHSDPEAMMTPCVQAELATTVGVLIHIPPAQLELFMRSVIEHSTHYVLAVEYESDTEEEVEYRGQMGLLWKRPYGAMYEALGLTLVDCWDAGEEVGFDRCTSWLLEKP